MHPELKTGHECAIAVKKANGKPTRLNRKSDSHDDATNISKKSVKFAGLGWRMSVGFFMSYPQTCQATSLRRWSSAD